MDSRGSSSNIKGRKRFVQGESESSDSWYPSTVAAETRGGYFELNLFFALRYTSLIVPTARFLSIKCHLFLMELSGIGNASNFREHSEIKYIEHLTWTTRKKLSNLGPFISILLIHSHEQLVFFFGPISLFDLRVEVIIVSLATLFSGAIDI